MQNRRRLSGTDATRIALLSDSRTKIVPTAANRSVRLPKVRYRLQIRSKPLHRIERRSGSAQPHAPSAALRRIRRSDGNPRCRRFPESRQSALCRLAGTQLPLPFAASSLGFAFKDHRQRIRTADYPHGSAAVGKLDLQGHFSGDFVIIILHIRNNMDIRRSDAV